MNNRNALNKLNSTFPAIFILLFLPTIVNAQQEENNLSIQEEMRLESQAAETETVVDDDSYLLQLNEFRRHPISVNTADEDQLRELRIITDLQIRQLINYRSIFGAFISIYELQAVPGWDVETLRKLKPFIGLSDPAVTRRHLVERFRGGESNLMFRSSFVPQTAVGFIKDDSGVTKFPGSRSKLFARYQYNYKNLLQFGLLGDKDAGEQFFRGVQKAGFDFYSYHFFVRKAGRVHSLALGDFTVSMGQGLIHWQGSGLRKNAEVMMVKRQGEVLKPYRSAGEYNFERGAGITVKYNRFYLTGFASYRKFTATTDVDSTGLFFSAVNTSGYHRTITEARKRKNLGTFITGGVIKYLFAQGSISFNTIHHFFPLPAKAQGRPYDLYGATGNRMNNYSLDYSYTFRNIHTYGELAVDVNRNLAVVQGMLASLDKRLDLSVVYRNISPAYQAFAGNTFTENSTPSNEKAIYLGVSLRPDNNWVVNVYSDFFASPWLRFKTDVPARGRGYLAQVIHKPTRKVEIYTRYSNEQKLINVSGSNQSLPAIQLISKKEWRLQFSTQLSKEMLFRSRVSMSWYGEMNGDLPQKGFLGYTDLVWKPSRGIISGSVRLQYFDIDDYNARIYAYESGPLYDMSIPAIFDGGWRYYVNARLKPGKMPFRLMPGVETTAWLRWAQTIRSGEISTGSGNDLIESALKSEVRLQLILSW